MVKWQKELVAKLDEHYGKKSFNYDEKGKIAYWIQEICENLEEAGHPLPEVHKHYQEIIQEEYDLMKELEEEEMEYMEYEKKENEDNSSEKKQ